MTHKHEAYIGYATILIAFLFLLAIAVPNNRQGDLDIPNDSVACTMDAKQCPDGSYVGRVGPYCEFKECPPLAHEMEDMKAAGIHIQHELDHRIGEALVPIYDPEVHKAREESLVTVNYTENGFEPEAVIIKQGSTIEFVNKSNYSFWPASDFYPDSQTYPEFNAKTEIPPGGKYTFTFDKVGKWGYHNHLEFIYEGLVEVQ